MRLYVENKSRWDNISCMISPGIRTAFMSVVMGKMYMFSYFIISFVAVPWQKDQSGVVTVPLQSSTYILYKNIPENRHPTSKNFKNRFAKWVIGTNVLTGDSLSSIKNMI